jgi:hypothetical protein
MRIEPNTISIEVDVLSELSTSECDVILTFPIIEHDELEFEDRPTIADVEKRDDGVCSCLADHHRRFHVTNPDAGVLRW